MESTVLIKAENLIVSIAELNPEIKIIKMKYYLI
jgi:hypothetical protein